MNEIFLGIVIIFPILAGVLIPQIPFGSRNKMLIYTEAVVLITTVMVFALIFNRPEGVCVLFSYNGNLSVSFHMDGLGMIFSGMVAFLWPLATLYSFEYMEHEKHEDFFFMFYTITYGITLGVALSENIVTLYMFFEALSLITLPLIMLALTREAIHASRTYFYYMIGGAAFAFIAMIFILAYGTTTSFRMGGVLDPARVERHGQLLRLVYVLGFCGFSVKAAIFPFSSWLPKAGVAPTPVTALLHAVAVVKTGVFSTMRLTYYSYGTDLIRGTWAQDIVMTLAIITIVYGCSRALKETHIKRRLAWSTVSNLSYILFSITLMTPLGLKGAVGHMISHAFMKICAFFCAGAIMHKTGRHFIHQLDGMGRRMPLTFIALTFSGLGLMGVPGLCGFISKWDIVKAATETTQPLAWTGVAALLISALLTAIYMLTISVRAFFPGRDFDYSKVNDCQDPSWMMILPFAVFIIFMITVGLFPQPLLNLINHAVTMI